MILLVDPQLVTILFPMILLVITPSCWLFSRIINHYMFPYVPYCCCLLTIHRSPTQLDPQINFRKRTEDTWRSSMKGVAAAPRHNHGDGESVMVRGGWDGWIMMVKHAWWMLVLVVGHG